MNKPVRIKLHDMCLRDGMHPKRHQISLAQMESIACGLDAAGVPLIEVTHGDGLGGASINYGFPTHTDEEYLRHVVPKLRQAKVSVLLIPGIGTVKTSKSPRIAASIRCAWRRYAPRPTSLNNISRLGWNWG